MIIVTGATGALNGATVDRLLDLLPADELVVAVRDPGKAQRFAELGVEVRRADYNDPETLPSAFDGADQLLLVSSNDPHADGVTLLGGAVDAAADAGVGRILYTSHQGASADTPFFPGRDHAATEERLAASGVPWTSLRNGFYAHSLGWLLGPWRETGVIEVPADGPVSWTAREDEAEAAARILISNGAYEGRTTLTAAAAPTFAEVAVIASELSGREIAFAELDAEAWVARRVASGHTEFMARATVGMFQAAQRGFFAGVDPLLGELLGREPRTVRDALALRP